MKRKALNTLIASFVLAYGGVAYAQAQDSLPNAPAPSGEAAAGAPGEETYLPGPGGGKIETGGPPPLESTGLGDGPGGCSCSSALSSRASFGSLGMALGLALVVAGRRRPRR